MSETKSNAECLKRIEAFAHLMDAQFRIPFTNISIGIDGLIGLIPGVGDGIAFLLALYQVIEARRMGAGFGLIAKMLLNIAIDTIIGSVPILGDIFDIGFKANIRNAKLLRKFLGL